MCQVKIDQARAVIPTLIRKVLFPIEFQILMPIPSAAPAPA